MARNMKGESEFGLPSPMPVIAPDGSIAEGSAIPGAIAAGGLPVATGDAEAWATGADRTVADELRKIYAKGEGSLGPGKVGNSELKP